jgi:hypothetical protein
LNHVSRSFNAASAMSVIGSKNLPIIVVVLIFFCCAHQEVAARDCGFKGDFNSKAKAMTKKRDILKKEIMRSQKTKAKTHCFAASHTHTNK